MKMLFLLLALVSSLSVYAISDENLRGSLQELHFPNHPSSDHPSFANIVLHWQPRIGKNAFVEKVTFEYLDEQGAARSKILTTDLQFPMNLHLPSGTIYYLGDPIGKMVAEKGGVGPFDAFPKRRIYSIPSFYFDEENLKFSFDPTLTKPRIELTASRLEKILERGSYETKAFVSFDTLFYHGQNNGPRGLTELKEIEWIWEKHRDGSTARLRYARLHHALSRKGDMTVEVKVTNLEWQGQIAFDWHKGEIRWDDELVGVWAQHPCAWALWAQHPPIPHYYRADRYSANRTHLFWLRHPQLIGRSILIF